MLYKNAKLYYQIWDNTICPYYQGSPNVEIFGR